MRTMESNTQIWVVINHKERTIYYAPKDGRPIDGDGTYMSLQYYTHHYNKRMIEGYTWIT